MRRDKCVRYGNHLQRGGPREKCIKWERIEEKELKKKGGGQTGIADHRLLKGAVRRRKKKKGHGWGRFQEEKRSVWEKSRKRRGRLRAGPQLRTKWTAGKKGSGLGRGKGVRSRKKGS